MSLKRHFVVMGCGRVGSELAYRLYQRGHEVVVMDEVGASFLNLHPDFRGRTIEGEVLSREVLRRAEIERAHGLAAVTNSDTVNAVLGHVARTVFKVPIVVVRNYNPRFLSLHETFGHTVVASAAWGANRIEELLSGDVERTVGIGSGEVSVSDVIVPKIWEGREIRKLLGGVEAVGVAVTRGGKTILATPEVRLAAGDRLHVSGTPGGLEQVRRRLSGEE